MIQIRYPSITGKTPEERTRQIEAYLRTLVDQLNWALNQLEKNREK